jgi:hypothetical protein
MADAKLNINRLDDDSVGGDVVIAHNELEEALGKILGIKLATQIGTAVFGGVNADGSVTLMRFKSNGVVGSPANASGLEFEDAISRKRLVMVQSHLQIWEADDKDDPETSWTMLIDFEEEFEPALVNLTDVQVGSPTDGYVLGVSFAQNGDLIFVQRQNESATDGAQIFRDLTDIAGFTYFLTGNNYDAAKVGWILGVKDEETLQPVPPDQNSISAYVALISHHLPIGQVGIAGNGFWTTIRWQPPIQGSTITSFSPYNGYANAGISLPAGVYRCMVTYRPTDWVVEGFVSWKMVGAPSFPTQIRRQHNPYERHDGPGDPFREPPGWGNSGGWGQQEQWLVVPSTTTVGLMMGRESAAAMSVYAMLAIERII